MTTPSTAVPVPAPPAKESLKLFALLLSLLVVVCGIAFAAGKYPTRSEWENHNARTLKQIDLVKNTINTMQIEQAELNGAIDAIKTSQARSEGIQNEIRQSITNMQGKRKQR